MKKIILMIGTAIESLNKIIFASLLLLFSVYVIIDNFFSLSARFSGSYLFEAGKEIAGAGVLAFSTALAYFIIRTVFVTVTRQKGSLTPSVDGTFKTALTFLRMIHPAVGTTAVALLAAHGYTVMKHGLAWQIDPLSASGATALTAGSALLIAGILLYRKRTASRIRSAHRLIAIICAVLAAAHIIAVKIIA